MNVYDCFIPCESKLPEKHTPLRQTSFALRRTGVDGMDALCKMIRKYPKKLAGPRDIDPQSLAIVDEVLRFYQYKEKSAKAYIFGASNKQHAIGGFTK